MTDKESLLKYKSNAQFHYTKSYNAYLLIWGNSPNPSHGLQVMCGPIVTCLTLFSTMCLFVCSISVCHNGLTVLPLICRNNSTLGPLPKLFALSGMFFLKISGCYSLTSCDFYTFCSLMYCEYLRTGLSTSCGRCSVNIWWINEDIK